MPNFDLAALEEFDSARPRVQLLHDSEHVRIVLFCLEAGQVVSPHSVPPTVIMHAVRGEGTFIAGDSEQRATAGTVVVCEPHQSHGMAAGDQQFVVLATIAPRPGGGG